MHMKSRILPEITEAYKAANSIVVPLELGGADTLDNFWPQCDPIGAPLPQRFFKEKEFVENYLANQIKSGRISLFTAQTGIAKGWTQWLNQAKAE